MKDESLRLISFQNLSRLNQIEQKFGFLVQMKTKIRLQHALKLVHEEIIFLNVSDWCLKDKSKKKLFNIIKERMFTLCFWKRKLVFN